MDLLIALVLTSSSHDVAFVRFGAPGMPACSSGGERAPIADVPVYSGAHSTGVHGNAGAELDPPPTVEN